MVFRRNFFVSQCRKSSQATLLCCVSENFRLRKSLWIRGGYQDVSSKIFCLTLPIFFVGESSIVALISGTENVWIGWGLSRFSVENFLSHSAEIFRR